jgi:hypothetical protein
MKGARAKREAEAAAAAAVGGAVEPTAPEKPRDGPPRPGPIISGKDFVQIPGDVFDKICRQIRTNELLGAAAADALYSAAGLRPMASPQGKAAQEVRKEIASQREDGEASGGKKAKKVGGFLEATEIPDAPPADEDDDPPDSGEAEKEQRPELNLNPKQNKLRTDLEMFVMDELPGVFGVDDSEELEETLQEDGQAEMIENIIRETDDDARRQQLRNWIDSSTTQADSDKADQLIKDILSRVTAIHDQGVKKKKKKAAAT